jgi:hypothetical protein
VYYILRTAAISGLHALTAAYGCKQWRIMYWSTIPIWALCATAPLVSLLNTMHTRMHAQPSPVHHRRRAVR